MILRLPWWILSDLWHMRTQFPLVSPERWHWPPRNNAEVLLEKFVFTNLLFLILGLNGLNWKVIKQMENNYWLITLVHELGFSFKVGGLPSYFTLLNFKGPVERKNKPCINKSIASIFLNIIFDFSKELIMTLSAIYNLQLVFS